MIANALRSGVKISSSLDLLPFHASAERHDLSSIQTVCRCFCGPVERKKKKNFFVGLHNTKNVIFGEDKSFCKNCYSPW